MGVKIVIEGECHVLPAAAPAIPSQVPKAGDEADEPEESEPEKVGA